MSKAMDALDLIRDFMASTPPPSGRPAIDLINALTTLRDYITTTEAEMTKGVLAVEIDRGVEGLSLSIMSYENNKKDSGVGERLDGPKPWGGGRALYSCTVDKVMAEQILEEIYRTYPDAQPKIDCRPQAPGRDESAARIKELEEALMSARDGLEAADSLARGPGTRWPPVENALNAVNKALSGARKVNSLGSVRGDEHLGAMLPDDGARKVEPEGLKGER